MSDTDAIWVGWTIGLILGLIIGCLLGGGRKRDQAEVKKLSSSPHQSHPEASPTPGSASDSSFFWESNGDHKFCVDFSNFTSGGGGSGRRGGGGGGDFSKPPFSRWPGMVRPGTGGLAVES
ncbi:hypothetical protein CsSME_00047690 [Camellia sinensis var. sinensis]